MPNPIKAVKAVKKLTAGKVKVNKKVEKLDTIAEGRTGGNLGYVYKKGKMIEVFGNHSPIKVKPRNIGKLTKQMAPSTKKASKKIDKIIKKEGKAVKPNELLFSKRSVNKVPVKRRGR